LPALRIADAPLQLDGLSDNRARQGGPVHRFTQQFLSIGDSRSCH
jgi:hypothetical protein